MKKITDRERAERYAVRNTQTAVPEEDLSAMQTGMLAMTRVAFRIAYLAGLRAGRREARRGKADE